MADETPGDEHGDEADPDPAEVPDDPGDATEAEPPEPPLSELDREELEARLETLERERDQAREEADDLLDRLQRLKADFDNYRKRKEREMAEARTRAEEELLEDLVGVLDSFERALEEADDEAAREGIRMIRKQFMGVLRSRGVERVDPEGEAFDPAEHEAVLREATDEAQEGDVLQVLEPGYVRDGAVIRPARVKVAAAPEAEAGDGS